MRTELRSPNIHEPRNLSEFNATLLSYREQSPVFWAGGTEIMSEPGFYPANRSSVEIISLDRIEELHHFLRNDRFAEFGVMVTLNEITQAGKLVLPKILLETISSMATRTIREKITIGGALCTRRIRTPLAATLTALDAVAEVRLLKKRRSHSKWFQLSRLYGKDGSLALPGDAIVTKVRIAIQQYDYQYFRITSSPTADSADCVALSACARIEQNSISYARIAITFPDKGFVCNRDLDNLVTSMQLPIAGQVQREFTSYCVDQAEELLGSLSPLREARLRALVRDFIRDVNGWVLSRSGNGYEDQDEKNKEPGAFA